MPCCSTNGSQRSSAITSIRLETERFSKAAICSSLFRCSSRTVRLSFPLFLFFFDFLFVTLEPGPYTAIVSSEDSSQGVGLVEVYDD